MSIEDYMINQIRENLSWLVKNTDVAWTAFESDESDLDRGFPRTGIRFDNSVGTVDVIWEDEA